MKTLIPILFLFVGISWASQGEWIVTQKSSHEIEFSPSPNTEPVHTVEFYLGKELVLECTIGDREKIGHCEHGIFHMKWKAEKYKNWLNPHEEKCKEENVSCGDSK